MNETLRKSVKLAAPLAIGAAALMAIPATAGAADTGSSYQATLTPLNNQHASGTLMLQLNGSSATITEHVTGLAATFMGQPYPHVQHIHGLAQGQCPTASADQNGDGVVNTAEGQPAYGGIQTTLSVSGDTSPSAATNIKIAPSGGSFDYSRTIELSADAMKAIQGGTAVIVVHGLDPSLISQQAQNEKSELVPSLPLAATSPALCGKLVAAQTSGIPNGSANTGGGSTAGFQHEDLVWAGGALLAAAGGALALRRRSSES